MISLLSFIFVITISVVIHEGGHFLAALWRNVQVHEFAIGMGPTAWSRRIRGVKLSVRVLPIGGFVRLEGMDDERSPEDVPDPSRSYDIRGAWERVAILAAGAIFNIILAWVLAACILMFQGVFDTVTPCVGTVIPHSAAASMGAREGDIVVSINGIKIDRWPMIRDTLQKLDTDETVFEIERGGERVTLRGEVRRDAESGIRLWGVQPSRRGLGLFEAVYQANAFCFKLTGDILLGLRDMILGRVEGEVAGPVGIAVMAGDAARQGFWTFISFLAVININLGIMNLLPIPALDGGHIFMLLISKLSEAMLGKALPQKFQRAANIVGFALLLALIAYISFKDVLRLWTN